MNPIPVSRFSAVLLVLAGPALVGACLGLPFGAGALLSRSASLAAIVLGVGLLMLPALYIGAAFLGLAPPARIALPAAVGALRETSIVLLGLAPALAFLVATSTQPGTVWLLGHLVLGFAALLGLRSLHTHFFTDATSARALPLYAVWSAVLLGIGWRLFVATLAA